MRICLIGPGDIEFHYQKLLKIPKQKFDFELEKIAQSLIDSKVEVECLPDKGVSFQLAKLYKQKKGKKVIAIIPKSDKTFGIKHLEPYINEKINDKPVFDELINSGDWFKHDLIKGLFGDAILYLGSSPGTNGEFNYAIYLHRLFSGNKKGIELTGKAVHPEIRAGKNFTAYVYAPVIKDGKLSTEIESYLKEYNIKLVYINNPEQLKDEILVFNKD